MSEPNSKLFRDDPATYYVELGAKSERERIIKLLDEFANRLKEYNWQTGQMRYDQIQDAIELIKGEAE